MVGSVVVSGGVEEACYGTFEPVERGWRTSAHDEPAATELANPSDRFIERLVRRRVEPIFEAGHDLASCGIVDFSHLSCSVQKRVPWSPSGGAVRTGRGSLKLRASSSMALARCSGPEYQASGLR